MIEQLQEKNVIARHVGEHGVLIVCENKLFRWLCFDDEQAIQSCMPRTEPTKLVLPYQQFMMMWQLLRDDIPNSANLLGVGGGDIIRYLRSSFPSMKITAVDSEPQIVKIAHEYFAIKPDKEHLILQIEDAQTFIKTPQHHDLLFVDITANNVLPDFLHTPSFWQDCHASLNENGIMMVNILSESEEAFVKLLQMLRNTFGHLPWCMSVPDHKNIVLLMPLRSEAMASLSELQEKSATLEKGSDLPFLKCTSIIAKDNPLVKK